MSKPKYFLIVAALFLALPLNILAQDEPISCGVECETDGKVDPYQPEPYFPSECELRMWDIYAAADLAVQDLFKQPVCEELVNSWYSGGSVGSEPGVGIETVDSVSNFVQNTSIEQNRNVKKTIVSKRKLRRLRRAASRCSNE
jgi:hypothetical protein